jgi:hypothetical protein
VEICEIYQIFDASFELRRESVQMMAIFSIAYFGKRALTEDIRKN